MKKLLVGIIAIAGLIGRPALAASASVPIRYSWAGFYAGIEFGGGWNDQGVNYSADDPLTAFILSGGSGANGQQPAANGYRISQAGAVGGFEAGYNCPIGTNWLLGVETDFSFAGMSGTASGTSFLFSAPPISQTTTAQQRTQWYGTVRGRAGWLVAPNLLLFGTGGVAYGKVADSANYMLSHTVTFGPDNGFGATCVNGMQCFVGSSSGVRTGWTVGGGTEYLFDQNWSAKIEYQFVDLGSATVPVVAATTAGDGSVPASFSAAFRYQFNVVRVGLNYRY